jgi:hypothetical protein
MRRPPPNCEEAMQKHRPFFPCERCVEAKKRLSFGSLNPKPQLPLHTFSNAMSAAFCIHNMDPLLQICCSQEVVLRQFTRVFKR